MISLDAFWRRVDVVLCRDVPRLTKGSMPVNVVIWKLPALKVCCIDHLNGKEYSFEWCKFYLSEKNINAVIKKVYEYEKQPSYEDFYSIFMQYNDVCEDIRLHKQSLWHDLLNNTTQIVLVSGTPYGLQRISLTGLVCIQYYFNNITFIAGIIS